MKIDAHHHLWRYSAEEYGWIDATMHGLQRDFLTDDLEHETVAAGLTATVAVQARQTLEETRWLLELAKASSVIAGVVGWVPIADNRFAEALEELAGEAKLKGLRHVVQAEAAGFIDGEGFNRGIDALLGTGLVYDVLIKAPQLKEATRFVDRHPRQMFVVDHMGKPDIAGDGLAVWSRAIRELARRENVTCKVSGMVTEADWRRWRAEDLKRYFDCGAGEL